MASIQFSHVSKVYLSGTEAVKNFNLDVSDGELMVIVGSSGCGKSTILRMAAGLEDITTGELRIDGKVVNNLEPKKRSVAMVFQNYALFPNLTVAANMEFALKMQRVPKEERMARVEAMADMLGIRELLKRKAKGLSGGQCQRIAIGRALVCEPKLFLLDEPLSNLDTAMRAELREEIARLQRRLNVTTLYVTHDQTEAMTLGSRMVVMDHGEIQQVDTPQNIYCRPQNTFVAQFVGASPMNLFETHCLLQDRQIILQVGSEKLPLPEWKGKVLRERGYVGKTILAGIRAEDVYPSYEGTAIPTIPLAPVTATVESMDILGADIKLHMRSEDLALTAMARSYAPVKQGDTLTLLLAVEQLHLFDHETHMTIVH